MPAALGRSDVSDGLYPSSLSCTDDENNEGWQPSQFLVLFFFSLLVVVGWYVFGRRGVFFQFHSTLAARHSQTLLGSLRLSFMSMEPSFVSIEQSSFMSSDDESLPSADDDESFRWSESELCRRTASPWAGAASASTGWTLTASHRTRGGL